VGEIGIECADGFRPGLLDFGGENVNQKSAVQASVGSERVI